VPLAFGRLAEEGPTQTIAESQVRTDSVFILGKEFELVLTNNCPGVCVGLSREDDVAEKEVGPFLLKAVSGWPNILEGVMTVVLPEKRSFVFLVVIVGETILCDVPADDPRQVVENRMVRVQITVGTESRQAFAVIEKEIRNPR
jgi:hypothetical protein